MREEAVGTFVFHGVGQGLFYSGEIRSIDDIGQSKCFNFVYDCGTSSDEEYLTNEIGSLERRLKNSTVSSQKPVIDILFISHFHEDHVSGLFELFQRVKVENLVVSYEPEAWRVLLNLSDITFVKDNQSFLSNPWEFFLENGVKNIMVILGSGRASEEDNLAEEKDDSSSAYRRHLSELEGELHDLSLEPFNGDLNERLNASPERLTIDLSNEREYRSWILRGIDNSKDLTLTAFEGGLSFLINSVNAQQNFGVCREVIWRFQAENLPISKDTLSAVHDIYAKKIVDVFNLAKMSKDQLADLRKDIKNAFEQLSIDLNRSSLVVEHAPCMTKANRFDFWSRWVEIDYAIIYNDLSRPVITSFRERCPCMRFVRQCSSLDGLRTVLTGDVTLKRDESMGILSRQGAPETLVLQYPHHGSSNNAHEVFVGLEPKICVFSAGYGNTYRHPNKEPFERMRNSSRFVVNQLQSFCYSILLCG